MESMSLKGLTAVITGASRGIGKVLATTLAKEGVEIVAIASSEESLQPTVEEIQGMGESIHSLSCDLSKTEEVEGLSKRIAGVVSKVDILINNAGVALNRPIEETGTAEWLQCFSVNAIAPILLTRDMIPVLEKSNRATIINMGSVVAHKGYLGQAAYGSSKHALLGFTKVLAREVQPKGIRVHSINPGAIATEMIREARPDLNVEDLIQPQELVDFILYLLKNRNSMVMDDLHIRRATGEPWY
ncbi:MAG: SDR family oxidoreductase [Candidatus Omnitrophica bacterium]|nr:SDR family oxidoreductase [Candidatus Omnitrophota bacterium]